MISESLCTEEERAAARREHQAALDTLNEKLHAENRKLRDLQDDNRGNLSERESINKKIKSAKSKGKFLIIFGIIATIVGAILIAGVHLSLYGSVVCVVGAALVILGIIVFSGWKQYTEGKSAVDLKLSDYDKEADIISYTISSIQADIRKEENALAYIAEKEKHAKLDEWIESISTGYVGLYVTAEANSFDDTPREPQPKRYSSFTLDYAQVYINGMVYSTIPRARDRSMDIIEIDEPGTQKLQLYARYDILDTKFEWASDPTPIKPQNGSTFYWLHISTCQKGTKVYCSVYSSFEAFLQATGITKDEVMEKYL